MVAKGRIDAAGFIRRLRGRLADAMEEQAEIIVKQIQDNIDTQGPPHSTPGEYPHMVSGDLHRSVGWEMDRAKLRLRIMALAPHAQHVERIRPFISRTFRENEDEIVSGIIRRARRSE